MVSIGKALEETLSHYEKKEYDAAEKAVDELVASHPDFERGQFLKAVILEETGRAQEAEKHYAKAGSRFTLWYRLAMQLQNIDPQRALQYYERVSAMDPQNNMIWFNLGNLYEQMGRPDEARRCYRNLSPAKEVVSRILIPLGFMIFLISGAIMMIQHGDTGLPIVVIASAIFCLFWLKRDGGRALQMMMKKKKSQ
jgi:DNA-binding SARP family transcriptional activator